MSELFNVPKTESFKDKPKKNFEILDDPKFRAELKIQARDMADCIFDDKAELVFFLDKGARPIAWLIRGIWKRKYPETRMPEMRFIDVGHRDEEHHDTETFEYNNDTPTAEDQEQFENLFGKDRYSGIVYVIDDRRETGATVERATKMIKRANPGVIVKSKEVFQRGSYSRMPWSKHMGSTGVIEDGSITTRRISQPILNEIREKLLRVFEKRSKYPLSEAMESFCRGIYPQLRDKFTNEILPIAKEIEDDGDLTAEIRIVLKSIRNFQIPKIPDVGAGVDIQRDFFISLVKSWDETWKILQRLKKLNFSKKWKLYEELNKFEQLFYDAMEGVHDHEEEIGLNSRVCAAAIQYNEYEDSEKLREVERQLRSEIRALVDEI